MSLPRFARSHTLVLAVVLACLPVIARAATAGHPKPALNPCSLVTNREAASSAHARLISKHEAPLGPTCIFRFRHWRNVVTLVVEPLAFRHVLYEMRHVQRLRIRGRSAYCGDLGSPLLIVRLSGSRALVISAPCRVARGLAHAALTRLHR
jgi:hypothetical protein